MDMNEDLVLHMFFSLQIQDLLGGYM